MSEQLELETVEQLKADEANHLHLAETTKRSPAEVAAEQSKAKAEQAAATTEAQAEIKKLQAEKLEADNPIEAVEQAAADAADNQQVIPVSKKKVVASELREIRRHLPRSDKALSKVIHQPVVRVVSEAASKTVSRPSGLLGGGILAFAGSTGYLLFTKHIGVSYNYLLFLGFFVGGFALGLVLEFIIWAANGRSRKVITGKT